MCSFRTILIPVDFSDNTDVSVKKAIEIADPEYCAIHLLHVVQHPVDAYTSLRFIGERSFRKVPQEAEVQKKLMQWKVAIEESIPQMKVRTHIVRSEQIQNTIIEKAKQISADLVVVGKKTNHSWLPFLNTVSPNLISRRSGCAVLAVKPGALHNKVKTLLVPVTNDIPLQKMEVIQTISKKYLAKIHLITFMDQTDVPEQFSASALLRVFQWLKTNVRCPIEYIVLHGANKTKALLSYAEKIDADMLLVYSKPETTVSMRHMHICDVLPAASKVQVLMVQSTISQP